MPNDMHDAIRADAALATAVSDIRSSGSLATLADALAAAQGEFTSPEKDRTVKVKTQGGQSYSFDYATLDSILKMARPVLCRHKLALTQLVVPAPKGGHQLVTKLLHGGSGEWLESTLPLLVQGSGPQAMGSAITYARRYAITALLCVCAEEDDDGVAAEGNHVEGMQHRQQRQQAQQQKPPPRQEPPRTRDGSPPAWMQMAWPVANKAGGHEDAREAEAWVNTFARWIENIQRSDSLPMEMKPQMIASLRDKHREIAEHLARRGDEGPVEEVATLFRKALKEEE